MPGIELIGIKLVGSCVLANGYTRSKDVEIEVSRIVVCTRSIRRVKTSTDTNLEGCGEFSASNGNGTIELHVGLVASFGIVANTFEYEEGSKEERQG